MANMVVARLEKCLAPIVERLFNSLAAEFISKLESIVDGYVVLCYMVICKASLAEGYSEALSA